MSIIEKMTIFATIVIAYVAGFLLHPLITSNILNPHSVVRLAIFFFYVLAPIIILALTLTYILSDDGSKKREFEWELALIIARKSEPRIIGKISEIIESKAIDTFKEVKDQEGKNLEARAQIKAKHILEVWNQLFEEEKEESQE